MELVSTGKARSFLPDKEKFQKIYRDSLSDILRFWTADMQAEIGRHNAAWRTLDFPMYLKQSELRYWIAANALQNAGPLNSLCDVGGFFGAFPLTMRRLGVDVAMTEALEYYSDSFAPLFTYLRTQGIDIIDHDPFEKESGVEKKFDAVTAMAVIEHYPHSLKPFMGFMQSICAPSGHLYLEAPNIAYWPRRWAMVKGQSPLSRLEDIFESSIPFIGHHHEYTMSELRRLALLTNMDVVKEIHFNYSFTGPWIKRFISDPLLTLMSANPAMREVLAVVLRPKPSLNKNA
jgi:2-polyprenyl-3-methyl-5-hydroxy-6-metoxy-1,4-benzoquinol methylase